MENNELDRLLNEEMVRQLEELAKTNAGSEVAKDIVDDFVSLNKAALERQKLMIEADKNKADNDLEQEKLRAETEAREEKAKSEKKLQIIQSVIQGAGIVTTIAVSMMGNMFTSRWLREILHFEEHGTIASLGGRSIIGSIGRKK